MKEKDKKTMPDSDKPEASGKEPKQGKKKRHVLRWLLISLLTLFVAGCVAFYFVFDVANWQQLDVSKILEVAQTGSIVDKNGDFISYVRGAENRTVVPLSAIPLYVQQAFIAAEDVRFYSHFGFDPYRILGAVVENVRSGGYSQGASTITQQLIKLSHLSTQKTLARKFEEIYLAVMLEQQYTKDQIMEMYLNYIYFNRGAYGIQAASQAFFSKDVGELTVAEAAALAATIKAPSAYSLDEAPEANKNRRTYVLDMMLEEGFIDAQTHDEAVNEQITITEGVKTSTEYGWFVDAVLAEAELQLDLSSEALLGGGYRIETTLDTEMQRIADEEYKKKVFPPNASDGTPVQSAMAVVDISNGAVRAIEGGREYTVKRGLNRATSLRRQPGSALKPLVAYTPAIEYFGYNAASVLKDEPTNFGGYKPRNSGNAYYGPVTFRTALKNSLNVAAVSLLGQIGVEAGRNYLKKVGIPVDAKDSNLSLALGAMTYGVSPVELAAAYAPLGNGGVYYDPYFIERILDANGSVVYKHEAKGERVISAQTAYLMTNLLQSVTSSGTGAKLSTAGTPVAGKTGTNSIAGGGNRDIWMAAYNSKLSVVAWMGFDKTDSAHRLSGGISGGDNTAAVVRDFFQAYYKSKDKPQFQRPGGIISLDIDKKSIEWRGEAMLATALTPETYRYSEVFTEKNHPTKQSDVWNAPRTPNSFYVTHNDAGNPLLVIQPADNAIYRIQRDAVGESFILTELWGAAGETLYYADTRAALGVVYTYRVIPVHSELLQNGILLEGVQSVQVAQAQPPKSGSILRDMFGFLFGDGQTSSETHPKEVENVNSIFWH